MSIQNRIQRPEVPYLNNLHFAVMVVLINMPLAMLFQYGRPLTWTGLQMDAAICGWTTVLISFWVAKRNVSIRWGKALCLRKCPLSPLMQKMPRSLFAFSLVVGIPAAASMWLITVALLRFFPDTEITFLCMVAPEGWLSRIRFAGYFVTEGGSSSES